ncbi:hypothetical protein CAFE_38130 [Caprobacter fermentans]|uniref:DUF6329 domain-containing protein n=1 Tax=Caproicibacter fermentans TaxID=2576756 RepID=A0A6N8I517_9FIRM|nr:DUF6329 domain-containing protein [Caproicibacter fermentans]MVB13058.1 hypothetical protein [Caproicibacter fermentans]
MKAIFERKPSDFDLRSFEVSKTIRLPAEDFEAVLQKPMRDYDFIQENIEQMHCDSSGVYHCLLLTGEGKKDGLLVESEGYGYCRYASYIPNISALTSPALQQFNQKMMEAVDYIVSTGTQNTTEGNWIISFDELAQQTGFEHDFNSMDTLMDMLHEREEVANVELGDSSIDVCYYLDFCPQYGGHPEESEPEQLPEAPSPVSRLKDLLYLHWEDIHLFHKDVEVQPATIVELNEHTLTDAGKVAWADVLDAEVVKVYNGYYGLQMELDKVKPSRLEEFSSMLAGYCPVSDYETWVTQDGDTPLQSPEMK